MVLTQKIHVVIRLRRKNYNRNVSKRNQGKIGHNHQNDPKIEQAEKLQRRIIDRKNCALMQL